jgi:hypothetical protein
LGFRDAALLTHSQTILLLPKEVLLVEKRKEPQVTFELVAGPPPLLILLQSSQVYKQVKFVLAGGQAHKLRPFFSLSEAPSVQNSE